MVKGCGGSEGLPSFAGCGCHLNIARGWASPQGFCKEGYSCWCSGASAVFLLLQLLELVWMAVSCSFILQSCLFTSSFSTQFQELEESFCLQKTLCFQGFWTHGFHWHGNKTRANRLKLRLKPLPSPALGSRHLFSSWSIGAMSLWGILSLGP